MRSWADGERKGGPVTSKLLYHPTRTTRDISPFDEAVVAISTGAHVCIACPYIGLDYFSRIVDLSTSWRLVTDVEEWLRSQNHGQRQKICDFVSFNSDAIRHLPQLHAKVVIGAQSAMLGSANLTDMGIRRRTEMSIQIDDENQLNQLRAWFEELWLTSHQISAATLSAYVSALPELPDVANGLAPLVADARVPKPARLVDIAIPPGPEDSNQDDAASRARLIARLQQVGNRHWVEDYLRLQRDLLEALQIDGNDPRLVMSIPRDGKGWFLPISINNRYVLAPKRARNQSLIGIIYGENFDPDASNMTSVIDSGRFDDLPGEDPLRTPFFLRVRDTTDVFINDDLRTGWIAAARRELDRAKASPYRRFHQPECYRLAVDQSYQKSVLAEAFQ